MAFSQDFYNVVLLILLNLHMTKHTEGAEPVFQANLSNSSF